MNPKVPIKPFEHPLWATSRVFTDDEAMALLYRVAVDPAARAEMIEGYTRLALGISGQYLTILKSRRWIEEVVSAALLGVIEGVDALTTASLNDKVNPRAVVAQRIHWEISRMLKQEHAQCREITYVGGVDWFDNVHAQNERVAEIENALDSLAENETEQTVLGLRKLGYTDTEIADQLGLHQQSVQVIRQDLHRRFSALLPGRTACDEEQTTQATEGVDFIGASPGKPPAKRRRSTQG